MLLIPCPHCGERAQVEFAYGGDATKRRPADGAPDEAWYEYVYLRGNPRGPHREWWLHHGGCGRWIRVTRDTATHAVLGAEPAVDSKDPGTVPDRNAGGEPREEGRVPPAAPAPHPRRDTGAGEA